MQAKEAEASELSAQHSALKADLESLLNQRGQLEGIRSLLLRQMGAAAAGAGAGALQRGGSSSGGGSGAGGGARLRTTTIVGEGQV